MLCKFEGVGGTPITSL